MIIRLIAALLLLATPFVLLMRLLARPPANNPHTFLREGRRETTSTLVVCAGDSLTHGVNSGDYVSLLTRQLGDQGYEFVNAGLNGDLAYNVRRRLDDIIACQPDVVTLLIGTNDVLGSLNESWARYYSFSKKIPQSPTLDWYRHNLSDILRRLSEETEAKIAVLSLPMLGEELESDINLRVRRYNEVVREMAAVHDVAYLPLHETVIAFLEASPTSSNRPFDGAFRQTIQGTMAAVIRHRFQSKSWDQIASQEGFALLIDQIHLNDRGAVMITDLIEGWLSQQTG